MSRIPRSIPGVVLLLLGSGCRFNFDRSLSPGEITGTAVYRSSQGALVPATGAVVVLENSRLSVTADAHGQFVLVGLPAGTFALDASAKPGGLVSGEVGLHLSGLAITAGNGLDLGEIVLEALGGISGTVTVNGGPPDSGAVATIVGLAETPVVNGGFQFPVLLAGDYQITALDPADPGALVSPPTTVHVVPAATTSATIALSDQPITSGGVQGNVQVSGASTNGGVSVQFSGGGPLLTTDASGNYSSASVPAGVYTVTASLSGYAPVSVPYVLVGGGTTVIPSVTLLPVASVPPDGGSPQPACIVDTECPVGQSCIGGVCEVASDAGPSDAGPSDAGPPDAGPSDAGPRDAGPSDAGPRDAGPSDAGSPDAGLLDAGITVLPPSGLTYATNPAVYTLGETISDNAPASGGGVVASYSISPELPPGLSLDALSGVIAGTPEELSPATSYTVTATNAAGSTTASLTITVNDVPPSNLMYAVPAPIYTKGQPITTDAPSSGGGAVVSYGISPALPTGLLLDQATGVISGTPTVVSPMTSYMVTATNSGGATIGLVIITVNDVAPSALTYSMPSVVYTNGIAITPDTPSNSGGTIVSYAISPELPTGLSIDPSSGIISGTPTALLPATSYTVIGSNTGGSTTAMLTITVDDQPPLGLTYTNPAAVYTIDMSIPDNVPSNTGGIVTLYAISPALPDGLSFDIMTGVIAGTPSVISAATTYMVTAMNTGGSATTTISITVNDQPPAALTYGTLMAAYVVGTTITNDIPSSTGGNVLSYGILPELPAGLSLDPSTGIISGTPTAVSPTTQYTVTATNSGGSAMIVLSITVNDVAPSGLTYTFVSPVYMKGQTIMNDAPSNGGGTVVSYAISPPLPTGLSLSPTTGVISGTPTVVSPATAYLVTGTNTGGSTTAALTITVNDVAPSALTYTSPTAVYTEGTAIPDNVPSNGGGTVVSYSITPALPAGLMLNPSSGVISGTPTALSSAASYVVTATNTGGSTTATISITVNDLAPAGLTYGTTTAAYMNGVLIPDNVPFSTGGAIASYGISPPLPAGLSLDPVSGVISGTPTIVSPVTTYTVTGTNSGGSTTVMLTITVNDQPPSALSYATVNATWTKGTPITSDVPSNSGGTVISYAVSPPLPTGLILNTSTGVISGTPGALSPATNYTVTATNTGGSTTGMLTITVVDVPPSGITYPSLSPIYTKGQSIMADTPTVSGGPVVSWGISPALPTGLLFSTASGAITGTPSVVAGALTYTVTATNTGGSTITMLTITVNDVAPSQLTYTTATAVYTKGVEITPDSPSNSGGAVVSYSVSPALPTGLSLDTSTGIISGTPSVVSSIFSYTVTATNTGGSTTVMLSITVNDMAPTGLSYNVTAPVYTKGVTITNDLPSNSGGTVTAYGISPALPTGLSLDPTTGILSGTPSVLLAATAYTVTASNSSGSTTAMLTITVNDQAPTSLGYSTPTAVYTKGVAITSNTPSNSGGAVVAYSISAQLPAGLNFSTTTGVISGTPTALQTTAVSYTVTATNTGGSTMAMVSITVDDVPPSQLSYTTETAVYTKGTAITNNSPTSSGGPVVSYSVSPALPTGLSLNTGNGIISGDPSVVAATASYTVTATNSGGPAMVTLSITVNDIPPSGLSYGTPTAVYTKGAAITSNIPTVGGGAVTSWGISPALPQGLAIDPSSGVITGTPMVVSASTSYTVTATNSGGFTTSQLGITVNDVAPTGLTYSTQTAVYTDGTAITENDPSNSGGTVVSYSVSPALPTGLNLSTSTGAITGTPMVLQTTAQTYTVTATNTGGSTTDMISITVNAAPPAGLTYTTLNPVYTKNTSITDDTPSSTGGAVVSYSVSPSLPTGLSIIQSSGIIYGTPSVISPATVYTVTATNTGGSTTVMLTITVNDQPPSGLTYGLPTAVYTKGTAINSNNPFSSGGAVTSYSVSPPLPAGLTLSATTGTITGTPTVVAATLTYTVTASNSGGSATAMISITVNDIPPSTLTYSTNPAIYVLGQTITPNSPASSGGAVVSYSIGSQLPAGLSFNTSTGVITGLPTVAATGASYVVTATNSGGSTSVSLFLTVDGDLTSGPGNILALADAHACAVVSGGVQCWGFNGSGELGDNSNTQSLTPIWVSGLTSGAQALTGGIGLSCALVSGTVECWGDNLAGELGNNSTVPSSTVPVQVVGLSGTGVLSGVSAISAGDETVCAIVNGGADCWGAGGSGMLGNNATANSSIPVQVSGLTSGVQAISVGETVVCAVVNGGAQCWGSDGAGQLGNANSISSSVPVQVWGVNGSGLLTSGVEAITVGQESACALVNGAVACWGDNQHDEIGNSDVNDSNSYPVPVTGLTIGVQAITSGLLHHCALVNGGVACWGDNSSGQLGTNSVSESETPLFVPGLTAGVQALMGGADSNASCAVVNGGVQCWGDDTYGQLGNNSTTSTSIPGSVTGLTAGIESVAATYQFTCALVGGGVQCMGINESGELGNNSTTGTGNWVPNQVVGLTSNVQSLTSGSFHSCVIVNGGAQCWGSNVLGQLGNNSYTESNVPVPVAVIGSSVQQIAGGDQHTCAIVNGGAWCWGSGTAGQLGNGNYANEPIPVQVTGLTGGVQQITAGYEHSCAVVNGGAQCWGSDGDGQLGDNSTSTSATPVAVTGLTSGVQAIAAGYYQTCAVVAGSAQCWGYNNYGDLGNNSTANSVVPVLVSGLTSGVQAITGAPESLHMCALVQGSVLCWGFNDYAQLGDNSTTQSDVPVSVLHLGPAQSVSAGGSHTCAIAGGEVECWGQDAYGQLGNNSNQTSYLPVMPSPWVP